MYRKCLQLPPTPATHTHTHRHVCYAEYSNATDRVALHISGMWGMRPLPSPHAHTHTHTHTHTDPSAAGAHTHVEACASHFWAKRQMTGTWLAPAMPQQVWTCVYVRLVRNTPQGRCRRGVMRDRVGERRCWLGNTGCPVTALIWFGTEGRGGGGVVSEQDWHLMPSKPHGKDRNEIIWTEGTGTSEKWLEEAEEWRNEVRKWVLEQTVILLIIHHSSTCNKMKKCGGRQRWEKKRLKTDRQTFLSTKLNYVYPPQTFISQEILHFCGRHSMYI